MGKLKGVVRLDGQAFGPGQEAEFEAKVKELGADTSRLEGLGKYVPDPKPAKAAKAEKPAKEAKKPKAAKPGEDGQKGNDGNAGTDGDNGDGGEGQNNEE